MENKTTLQIIDSAEFGIEEVKATSIEASFLPKKIETEGFASVYAGILEMDIEQSETSKLARELRLKLVKVRTGISDIHKAEKAFFLASGKYVDALKNKLTLPVEQMEEKLSEIEKYQETKEKERKEKVKAERLLLLEPYNVDTTFVDIENMGDDQFNQFLEVNKTAFAAKLEAERLAEEKRIQEEKEAELKRIADEKSKEIERKRIAAENEKLKKEQEEAKKLLIIEQEKAAKKQAEQDALIKAEKEKAAKIELQLKKEREEKAAKLEAERLSAELVIKQQQEEEKARLLAPDKEKINILYLSLKNFEYPEVTEKESKEIIKNVKLKLQEAMQSIVESAKKLK